MFYWHIVVGENTYFIYTKMGARIRRTFALRRDCEVIIMYEYIYAVRSGDQFFYPSSRNL